MMNELRKRMKFIKTCNLYLCFFTVGMVASLTGPCLLDLQRMVRTDIQHIAMIFTARSTGLILGAIIGGVLLDLVRSKQAILMGCNFFVPVIMFAIPWSRSLEILMVFMSINGLTVGAINTVSNVIFIELWGKDSNHIFQGIHFTFSLGGLISPLIAAPFLENMKEHLRDINNTTHAGEEVINSTANLSSYVTNFTHISEGIPRIIYPFSIIGVIALIVTTFHLVVCIISPIEDESPKDTSKIDNSERSLFFILFTAIFTFLIFLVAVGIEIGYVQTLTTFAVKGKLHLTTEQGSFITSAFWAAFAVSRLASVFLSMKVSSLVLVMGDICLVGIAALILLFLMPNEWALWLASVIFGAGIASAYAALIGWINIHINISNKFSAIFSAGTAAGEMTIPFVMAYYIDTIPEMFSFVTAASAVLMMTLLFILYCIFKKGKKANESKNIKCCVIEAVETRN